MENSIALIFIVVFIIIGVNLYFVFSRIKKNDKHRGRKGRVAVDEAKHALWRDNEVARRVKIEDDVAHERARLRNETLAIYEEVKRRNEN